MKLFLMFLASMSVVFSGCRNHVRYSDVSYKNRDSVKKRIEYVVLAQDEMSKPTLSVKVEKKTYVNTKTYKIGSQTEYYVPYNPFCEIVEVPVGFICLVFCWAGAGAPGRSDTFWEDRLSFVFSCINPCLLNEDFGGHESEVSELSSILINTDNKILTDIPEKGKSITLYVSGKEVKTYKTNVKGVIYINLLEPEYLSVIDKMDHLNLYTVMKKNASIAKGRTINISSELTSQLSKASETIKSCQPGKGPKALAKTIFTLEKQKLSLIGNALESAVIEKHQNDTAYLTEYENVLKNAD